MELYDEDVATKDDLLFTVAYDVAKVKPGETVHEKLTFNSEVRPKMISRAGKDAAVFFLSGGTLFYV